MGVRNRPSSPSAPRRRSAPPWGDQRRTEGTTVGLTPTPIRWETHMEILVHFLHFSRHLGMFGRFYLYSLPACSMKTVRFSKRRGHGFNGFEFIGFATTINGRRGRRNRRFRVTVHPPGRGESVLFLLFSFVLFFQRC